MRGDRDIKNWLRWGGHGFVLLTLGLLSTWHIFAAEGPLYMAEQPESARAVCWKIPSAVHYSVLRATDEIGTYNHAPLIAWHRDMFFVCWTNHQDGEGGPGQRVLARMSPDGTNWGKIIEVFPPLERARPAKEHGMSLAACKLLPIRGALYVVAESCRGTKWVTSPLGIRRRAREKYGRYARSIDGTGHLGEIIRLDGKTKSAARIIAELLKPENTPFFDYTRRDAADAHQLSERTIYRASDGKWIALSRDESMSHCLYCSTSSDGKQWSPPKPTNIPDATSKCVAGILPGGTYYLIGNQFLHERQAASTRHCLRDPLTIALSSDGYEFTAAYPVRYGCPRRRYKGRGKGTGFQYPSATIANGKLWIVYSVNKEDIEMSVMNLSDLAHVQVVNRLSPSHRHPR